MEERKNEIWFMHDQEDFKWCITWHHTQTLPRHSLFWKYRKCV